MRIRWAWVWDDEQPRPADEKRLLAKFRIEQRRCVDTKEWPIAHHAVEACDTRLERFEFGDKPAHAGGEFLNAEFVRARCRPFHDVGEANAVIRQHGVVHRLQPIHVERTPRRFAKDGPRKCRPEPIRIPREIMPLSNRIKRRVDPDEHEVEIVPQQIRQGHRGLLAASICWIAAASNLISADFNTSAN